MDTEKYKYLIDILLQISRPILITGESGVGKTSLIVPYLFSLKTPTNQSQSVVSTIFLNFSAKTKPK